MCLIERGAVWEKSFCIAASDGIGRSPVVVHFLSFRFVDSIFRLASVPGATSCGFQLVHRGKKAAFLVKTWTTDRPTTGHFI
ncbi:hypothetical protein L596_017758 [Steinernema carpocapsae]|uniref:Uncharacterized protein n=1 Tax=Steinernema carpocapsae TaxID=34508 RepID=A0A4U5N2K6_STECR|nr:hypothetical protein L596_017758 [Steinernema carpocapsae]